MNIYQLDMNGYWTGAVTAITENQGAPAGWVLSDPPDLADGEFALWTGRWLVTTVPPTPDWPALIAARRYTAEIAGTTIEGMSIDTGRDSQGLITGAAVQAIIDPAYSLRWKTTAGFVELTGAQILGVASTVRAHVQDCFNREAALLDVVADGTITAALLEEGWPH